MNSFNKFLIYAEYTNLQISVHQDLKVGCLKPKLREYMLSPLNLASNSSGDDIIHMNRFSQCKENLYPEICIVCSTPPFNSRSHPVMSKRCCSRNPILEIRKVSLSLCDVRVFDEENHLTADMDRVKHDRLELASRFLYCA